MIFRGSWTKTLPEMRDVNIRRVLAMNWSLTGILIDFVTTIVKQCKGCCRIYNCIQYKLNDNNERFFNYLI